MSQKKSAQSRKPSTSAPGGTVRAGRGSDRARPSAAVGSADLVRKPWFLAAGGALLLVVGILLGWAVFGGSSGDDHDHEHGSDAVAVAEAEYMERQVTGLTGLVTEVYPDLVDVLIKLNQAVPVDQTPGTPLSADDLDQMAASLAETSDKFSSLAGGESAYNVARNGFALGVRLLGDAVGALQQLEGTDGDTAIVGTLRARGIDAWSTASTQLDLLAIDITGGHLHVTLPIAPLGDEAPDTQGGH